MLDQSPIFFPVFRLRMRFAARPPPRIGLPFSARQWSAALPGRRPGPLIRRQDRTFLRDAMSGGLNLVVGSFIFFSAAEGRLL